MLNPPLHPVSVEAATVAFDLMGDITDVADHMSANYRRASIAQQLLNGDLTTEQALAYAADIEDR